ncbi:MAG: NADP-dependent methylenetetrahydromethanopterin/ methylenetetrahydrofolate dehydrogenase [Chloroflexota bacterium]
MKKILLQLDSDAHPSAFDRVAAYDGGADEIMSYGGVTPGDARNLVYEVMFTRGGANLRNSAVFVGGASVAAGEALLAEVTGSFFGPVRTSVMLDSNGCNTTAAAAVARIMSVTDVAGKRVLIYAATGPVGMRAALLLARAGADVVINSRSLDRARATAERLKAGHGVTVTPSALDDAAAMEEYVATATVALTAGAPGVTLLSEEQWAASPGLKVLADVNAVPPLGIGGIKSSDNGKERGGVIAFGAMGIGSLKMRVHHRCIARLFETNDAVLDVEEIFAIAREV